MVSKQLAMYMLLPEDFVISAAKSEFYSNFIYFLSLFHFIQKKLSRRFVI